MNNSVLFNKIGWLLVLLSLSACNQKSHKMAAATGSYYTCPMHPNIRESHLGKCPICGMTLIAVTAQTKHSGTLTDASLSFVAPQLFEGWMLARLPGTIQFDERWIVHLSSRVEGRIDRIYVHYPYEPIRKGQKIMDVFSQTLYSEQQDLIFLLQNDPTNFALISQAKERLLLDGMSKAEISKVVVTKKALWHIAIYSPSAGVALPLGANSRGKDLGTPEAFSFPMTSGGIEKKQGSYISKGEVILSLASLQHLWATWIIYPEFQRWIKKGDPIVLNADSDPGKSFTTHINYLEPYFRSSVQALVARSYLSGMPHLMIGSRLKGEVSFYVNEGLWIPESSVLTLGLRQAVFVKGIHGGIEARQVQIGLNRNGLFQVLSGISLHDRIVRVASFVKDYDGFVKIKK